MVTSTRWAQLNTRLTQLAGTLPAVSATGVYSNEEQDIGRGYTLLAHAEIEYYLEESCRTLVLNAVKDWKSTQNVSHVLFSLVLSYFWNWGAPTDELSAAFAKPAIAGGLLCLSLPSLLRSSVFGGLRKTAENKKKIVILTEMVDAIHVAYIHQLDNNHGIKQDNLADVLVPAGIALSSLDPVWLTNMDNFGAARGTIAHKSKHHKVGVTIDPPTELARVTALLPELQKLDEHLCTLGLT